MVVQDVFACACVPGLLPVTMSLVGQFNGSVSGSAKNDAYLWCVSAFMQVHTHTLYLHARTPIDDKQACKWMQVSVLLYLQQ